MYKCKFLKLSDWSNLAIFIVLTSTWNKDGDIGVISHCSIVSKTLRFSISLSLSLGMSIKYCSQPLEAKCPEAMLIISSEPVFRSNGF